MIVTLEKEVEEPFDYKGLFLIWLTVLTDYDLSMDMDIETWRAVYDYKEKKVWYEITNIEGYDFENNPYTLPGERQKYLVKTFDDDTLKALQSFAEANSGHRYDEIIEEARKSA